MAEQKTELKAAMQKGGMILSRDYTVPRTAHHLVVHNNSIRWLYFTFQDNKTHKENLSQSHTTLGSKTNMFSSVSQLLLKVKEHRLYILNAPGLGKEMEDVQTAPPEEEDGGK